MTRRRAICCNYYGVLSCGIIVAVAVAVAAMTSVTVVGAFVYPVTPTTTTTTTKISSSYLYPYPKTTTLFALSRNVNVMINQNNKNKRRCSATINNNVNHSNRREILRSGFTAGATSAAVAAVALTSASSLTLLLFQPQPAVGEEDFLQQYADFIKDPKGWSYRDVGVGTGTTTPREGDRVVYEWSGYTIGYFGRPFEAKGGPQGGAFDKEREYSRIVIGSNQIVSGMESAMKSMKVGGIRQVIVPYGELGYPSTKDDSTHEKVGPKPTTFSGQRALNFVLDNPRVDRTLLFNVKLIRIDKSDGKGGFIRGDRP